MNRSGFILVEAIAAVVVMSVCLTLLAQSLLTNSRTGARFQESVRQMLVMENRIGLLYASNGSADQLSPAPHTLPAPYSKYTVSARTKDLDLPLERVDLTVTAVHAKRNIDFNVTAFVYNHQQVKTQSYVP